MATKPLPHTRLNSRRAEICRTAARIFRQRGFDATSVSDIARALKMTKAGLYHYFTSKEELLLEIMMFGLDNVRDEVILPARAIRDPEERLRQIVIRHAQITTRAEGAVSQLDELRALPPVAQRKVKELQRKYFDLVRETLRELKAAGRLRDVDLTVAAFSTIGMILWLPRWFRQGGRLNAEQASTEIANLTLASVLSSEKPKPRARVTPIRAGAKRVAAKKK
ncbi:MAG TPA: TetR/AcrR family transcriptional regulator [Vicinamibacterales bacterium]|nr:TetR/AcrR family transcriptional regulator [Vicinamibacterales bacterium]